MVPRKFVEKTGTRAKKGMKGEGEGSKGTNFRAIRLETLATQASCTLKAVFNNKSRVIPIT